MRLIANVLWGLLGGWLSALGWLFAALLMAITIIGLPWTRACLSIARFSLWPFGSRLVPRERLTGRSDIGTSPLGLLGNIIWFILGGWYLALLHLCVGIGWCLTVIGIPFGTAHFRLMKQALAPIGKIVVPAEIARRR